MRTRLSTLLALVLVLSLTVSGITAYTVLRITVNDRIEASLQRVVDQVALLSETGVDPETGEPPDSAAASSAWPCCGSSPMTTRASWASRPTGPSWPRATPSSCASRRT
ncbi:hypothetical protein E4A41_08920, partial [Micrococcus endophyticus]